MIAGIQVVIGENIERIYNQNCQNLGLLTTTNLRKCGSTASGRVTWKSSVKSGHKSLSQTEAPASMRDRE
jgi:3-isopropylmalate/(R)-2-methylmalate dehydratase large subunit